MPTPVFVCGAECGVTGGGTTFAMAGTSANGHWQTMDTGWTVDSSFFAPGGSTRSYKIATTTTAKQLARTFAAASNFAVARFKIMWTTLPSTATLVAWFDGGTSICGLRYNGGNLEMYQKSTGTTQIGPAVVTGRWYTVEMKWDTSANPWLGSWQVDGVPYGNVSAAAVAATRTGFIVGNDLSATQTMYVDDMIVSQTLADYPIGDGVVLGLNPISDGLHSFTAGDFKYDSSGGTNVLTTATDVYTHIDDTIDNTTDSIFQAVIRTTGYVEVRFKSLPWQLPDGRGIKAINGIAVVGGFHASASTACTCSLRIEDGATESAVFALLSPGATSIVNFYKMYATSPAASVPWQRGTLNGLLARFGYSSDVTPFPACDSLVIEADVAPTRLQHELVRQMMSTSPQPQASLVQVL